MKYWVESSYDHEDKGKEYPECLVVGADYGEHGTESVGFISLPWYLKGGTNKVALEKYEHMLKEEVCDLIKEINLTMKGNNNGR